ncbi:MAG: FMN-binding protein [Kiritimatiellia bacterium]
MKHNYLKQAWLVLVLAVCFGGALAGVEHSLSGRIKANKLADTLGQIPSLVPGAEQGNQEMVAGQLAYRAVDGAGTPVGWVVPVTGQGFADKIELLLGLNADASQITGIYILDQKETPGLGNKIVEPEWRGQFANKSISPALVVVKRKAEKANEIEAVTGATISSESVAGIVNQAAAAFRQKLAEGGQQ